VGVLFARKQQEIEEKNISIEDGIGLNPKTPGYATDPAIQHLRILKNLTLDILFNIMLIFIHIT